MNERYIKWWTPHLIAGFVDSGKITIYCPDSADLDSFYNRAIHPADRMRTHNAFERVIVGGAATIGITGAICCRTICRRYKKKRPQISQIPAD
jgi:esterase/lipase superfamily enzyme